MKKTILITGATGFVGQHLLKRLIKESYSVKVLVRDKAKLKEKSKNLEILEADIRDKNSLKEAVKGVDKIVHLAVCHQSQVTNKKYIKEINVESTVNLLNAAAENKISHFIHCSTASLMTNEKRTIINENSPYNFHKDDIYEVTKANSEILALKISKKKDLPLTIIRPSMIYGEGDLKLLKLIKLINNKKFIFIGNGNNYLQPIYVGDVIDCIMKILENNESKNEIFTITGNECISVKEFIQLIANELKVKQTNLHLYYYPFFVLAFLTEEICNLLNIIPPISRYRVRFFSDNGIFDTSKAKKILKFSSDVSLYSGMKLTIKWYQDNNLI